MILEISIKHLSLHSMTHSHYRHISHLWVVTSIQANKARTTRVWVPPGDISSRFHGELDHLHLWSWRTKQTFISQTMIFLTPTVVVVFCEVVFVHKPNQSISTSILTREQHSAWTTTNKLQHKEVFSLNSLWFSRMCLANIYCSDWVIKSHLSQLLYLNLAFVGNVLTLFYKDLNKKFDFMC